VEIHKPKPVHSLRELLTEIGVVVIGVCIALGAEQALDWVHWRNHVDEARGVIATEISRSIVNSIARIRSRDCTEKRLDELAAILDEASANGRLPAVGEFGGPPRRAWASGAWEGVVASQIATHFPRQQLADLAVMFQLVGRTNEYSVAENESWAQLSTMVGPGRRLDAASEADLRKAISLARNQNRMITAISTSIMYRVNALELPFNKNDQEAIAAIQNQPLTSDKVSPLVPWPPFMVCWPLGAVPAQYGSTSLPIGYDGTSLRVNLARPGD
jgi:hypothetical protein